MYGRFANRPYIPMRNLMKPLAGRCSLRLPGYDYTRDAAYFITICVRGRQCSLGEVRNGGMHLNDYGEIAASSWLWLAEQYSHVRLDQWIVMPNHLHGIIFIEDRGGGWQTVPTGNKPLGRLIGAFKTISTKYINNLRQVSKIPFWQRNYYDHIIRNDASLNHIREYILTNPLRWHLDRENPQAIGQDEFDLWLEDFNKPPHGNKL
jgi:putative transposase